MCVRSSPDRYRKSEIQLVRSRGAHPRDGMAMKTNERKVSIALLFRFLCSLALAAPALADTLVTPKYATDAQVEASFRGRSFLLVGDDKVAIVRAVDWTKDRSVSLPFWLGTGKAAPPALSPKQGKYYVISEAYLVRSLSGNEWLIRAGSSLQKPDAVFVTEKTRYKTTGVILPTIVQYVGTRTLTRSDGSKLDVSVLHEVSLPMTWTKGKVPSLYARFRLKP